MRGLCFTPVSSLQWELGYLWSESEEEPAVSGRDPPAAFAFRIDCLQGMLVPHCFQSCIKNQAQWCGDTQLGRPSILCDWVGIESSLGSYIYSQILCISFVSFTGDILVSDYFFFFFLSDTILFYFYFLIFYDTDF